MKKNRMKEKLSQGGIAIGMALQEPSVQIAEVYGLVGFDWLFIDCEHSPMSVESAAHLVLAADLHGMTPIVRVPRNEPETILRYMDMGALGVIAPGVSSPSDAERAVAAVKYPPLGRRGLAGVRANDYAITAPLSEYVKAANQETMVLALIETREGVENAEEIMMTEGVDGVCIGPNDLSRSLGVVGQTSHPLVNEAIERILAAGRRTGRPVAAGPRAGESFKTYTEKGYRIISMQTTGLVAWAARQLLDAVRT